MNLAAAGLYAVARSAKREKPASINRVVHISPASFGDQSVVGGGERYVLCLAQAMADRVTTTLVTFGPERKSEKIGRLSVEVYPFLKLINGVKYDPLCYQFLGEIAKADVVHCYQYRTVVTGLAVLMGRIRKKLVFVSDLGANVSNFSSRLPLQDMVDEFLPISEFGAQLTPTTRRTIIYGGVDQEFLEGDWEQPRERKALFVGRYMPHKGINYLIEGIDADIPLDVVGHPYDPQYFELLQSLAVGKQVRFVTDASDDQLRGAYRQASVTILPSVYDDVFGFHHETPELLGLVMLESMACGTPVICADVGSMPEFVEDGVTGFVVPPNDPQTLGARVRYLIDHPDAAREMGRVGRERVRQRYTWDAVARYCLDAYGKHVAPRVGQSD